MKKLIVFVLALAPALLNAQTGSRLVNRIDQQINSGGTWHLLRMNPQAAKSFNLTIASTIINFDPGVTAPLEGSITNLTAKSVQIIFHRTHLHLPSQDWSSSVCFGQNCFAAFVDSTPASGAYSLDPGVKGSFTMNFNSQDSLPIDSIVDYIRFTALSGDPGDTLSFILKGVLNPQHSGVQDQKTKSSISNPKIKAIYPSPLVLGDAIKVKITSPREGALSYSIYDGVGRVVALGVTRQHLNLGDNTISIASLDGLANGSYMLKLNFADGSSDTRFFQVMR